MAHEDLDFNPFYKSLQKSYGPLYEKAQSNGWLVVIPHSSSLRGVTLTQAFAEMHILKPSPYFQDQYITASKVGEFSFSIDDGVMYTESGFDMTFSANVMYEELAYSKDYKPFRILVTSRPLDPTFRMSQPDTNTDIGIPISHLLHERVMLNDHTRLLKSLPEYATIMIALDSALVQFNNNYIVVDGYLEHTAKKLDRLCAQGVETVYMYIPGMRRLANQDTRVHDSIRLAVESYIMGWVHQKVFRAVATMKNSDDEEIHSRCRLCSGLSPESLGVSQEFCCALPEAMVELTALDTFTTPLEKLNCLKNTLELITNGVQKHFRSTSLLEGNDAPASNLVSDDLIPILVTVIVQAKCNRLASNLYYVENFHWASSSKANLGYSLVTFQAATEYLLTTDLKHFVPATIEEDTTKENPKAAAVAAASKGRVILQVKHTSSNMENLRRAWESLEGHVSPTTTAATTTTTPAHPAATAGTASSSSSSSEKPARPLSAASSSSSSFRPATAVGGSGGEANGRGSAAAPAAAAAAAGASTRGTLWRRNTWADFKQPAPSVTDELAAAGVIPAPDPQRRSRTPNRSPLTPAESLAPVKKPTATQSRPADTVRKERPRPSRGSALGHWIDGMSEKLS